MNQRHKKYFVKFLSIPDSAFLAKVQVNSPLTFLKSKLSL